MLLAYGILIYRLFVTGVPEPELAYAGDAVRMAGLANYSLAKRLADVGSSASSPDRNQQFCPGYFVADVNDRHHFVTIGVGVGIFITGYSGGLFAAVIKTSCAKCCGQFQYSSWG